MPRFTPRQIDLDVLTLGPAFSSHTPQSFRDYVESLKEIKELGHAPPRPPRIKREPIFHKLDETKKRCTVCGKRARSEKAKCSGPAVENLVTTVESLVSENSLDEPTPEV